MDSMSLHDSMPSKYATFSHSPSAHPQTSASAISRLFLSWALPVIRTKRRLDLDDTWELLPEHSCAANTASITTAYTASSSVVKSFLRVYGGAYAWMGILGLIIRLLELVGPIVLNRVVSGAATPAQLYQWVGLLFLSMATRAFVYGHCVVLEETTSLRFSSGLKGLLFAKLLGKGAGPSEDVPELANVYASDMETLHWGLISLLNIWIMPVQIIAIVYMLFNEIGVAAFAGLTIIVGSLLLGGIVAKWESAAYESICDARDDLMKAVKETFGAVLILKLHAWEAQAAAKLHDLRTTELGFVKDMMRADVYGIFFLYAAPLFVSMASFATYTLLLGQTLTPAKIFTSLALFRMLQDPMSDLPSATTQIIEAREALSRIDEFLAQPDKPAPAPQLPTAPEVVLAMQGIDASYDNAAPHLTALSFEVRRGDLVVVHGKVGSGKTSLCRAILGELHTLGGVMAVHGRVSYCPQEAWIQHMSLRDNILFGHPFDARRYASVIDACGLVADFELMSAGDQTIANSKGGNLSGGQKARIGLARACYSDADIVLLDAPLAAIDAVVQSEIMEKCIRGLLRTKTVVLVTHNEDIIASEGVNRILHMDDGRIVDNEVRKPSMVQELSPVASGSEGVAVAKGDRWSDYFQHAMDEESEEKAENEEHRAEGQVAGAVFANYFAACGGTRAIAIIVMSQLLWQSFQVASDVWLSHWTTSAATADETPFYLSVYGGICLASILMVLVRSVSLFQAALRGSRRLFDAMTAALLAAPMGFFDANPSGRIINRYSTDMSSIDMWLPYNFGEFTSKLAVLATSLATSIVVVQWCGLLFIPILLAYVKLTQIYLQPSRDLYRLVTVSSSPVLSFLEEMEHGFAVIRAFGASFVTKQLDRHAHHVDANNRAEYCKLIVDQWFEIAIQLQGTAVVMVVAVSLVYWRQNLSAGLVGLAFNYILVANSYVAQLAQSWARIELNMVGPERVLEYCSLPAESTEEPSQSWQLQAGAIEVSNVDFQYTKTSDLVLRDVSFSIEAGEKIGIVGRTGAGKSSLTMVLFRMYPLVAGSIAIDGRNIASVPLSDLRRQISIIPQNPVLFKGTLRQYLDPFDAFSDDDLWTALRKVKMDILSLDTEVAERGANWSVGERQMLCLARALLVQARIVVLDEATAAIDHATDVHLQNVIATEFRDATVLTIAHRLHSVVRADRVLVMDAGRILAFDAPRTLVRDTDSIFYHLAKDGGVLDLLM
ncbi:ATP-binding Cassette (ABC) Superfamily [Achlya hypogyna]|uniref:ATP-binding Cassette (ABC) Superfamily n=1 Tax=Achlya hypogyna TaxID=1202772 RepID=A0A1V9YP56_ACHHY|nr:ATP-binding Cassette (ABC) Superfamily [Achlya hypogyna]